MLRREPSLTRRPRTLIPRVRLRSKVVRLSIAQVLTVIRQTQKKTLREAYAGKARGGAAAAATHAAVP